MKLSTRTRYGVRALFELALNYGRNPVQLKYIAERQDLSVKYLEHLFAILKSSGFIKSIRGAKGGYILAKHPNQIKLNDCVKALEGPIAAVECVKDKSYCQKSADCVVKQVWVQITEAIENVLKAITLQDLVDRAKSEITSNYQI